MLNVKRVTLHGRTRHGYYFRVKDEGKKARYYKQTKQVRNKEGAIGRYKFFSGISRKREEKREIREQVEEERPQAYRLHFRIDYKSERANNDFFMEDSYIDGYSLPGETPEQTADRLYEDFKKSVTANFHNEKLQHFVESGHVNGLEKKNVIKDGHIFYRYKYAKSSDFHSMISDRKSVEKTLREEKATKERFRKK